MNLVNDFVRRIAHFAHDVRRRNNNLPTKNNRPKVVQRHSEPELTTYIPKRGPSKFEEEQITRITTTIRSEATIHLAIDESKEESDIDQISINSKSSSIVSDRTSHPLKLQKENSVVSTVTGFTETEREEITRRFYELTKDGKLTKDQFSELYNELRTEDPERLEKITEVIYSAFDTNKDGVISLEEFLSGYTVTNYSNIKNKLNFLFGLYDRNSEGYLQTSDIVFVIDAMISLLDAELDLNAEKIAEECFRDLDANNDGKVSKEEFVNGLQKNYALRSLMSPFN